MSVIKIHTKIQLSISQIFCAICLLAQFARSSAWFKTTGVLDTCMTMVQIVCMVWFGMKRMVEKRFSYLDGGIMIFYLTLLISTLTVSKDVFSWATYAIQGIGSIFLIEELLEENEKGGIRLIRNTAFLFLLGNLATMVAFPNGMGASGYDLLGSRIGFTPYAVIGAAAALICEMLEEDRKFSLSAALVIAAAVLNLVKKQVSTGLIALSVMALLLLLKWMLGKWGKTILNYWLFLGIAALLFMAVVLMGSSTFLQSLLSIFQEDTTFGGRTIIWETALSYIEQRPVWGYGVTATGAFWILGYVQNRMLPAHNEILNILYQGGIVSLCAFLALFALVGRAVRKCGGRNIEETATICIFAFACVMITEIQTQKAIIFLMLAMLYQLGRNRWRTSDEKSTVAGK